MRLEDARYETFRAGLPQVLNEIESREGQQMDRTMSTVEMLTQTELRDAFEAYCTGTKIGFLAARLNIYPAELQKTFDRMTKERGITPKSAQPVSHDSKRYHVVSEGSERQSAHDKQANTIQGLQERLFRELDRLDDVDVSNKEALEAEVARSRAVEGISKAIIDNVDLMMRATQLKATLSVNMPKMLEG